MEKIRSDVVQVGPKDNGVVFEMGNNGLKITVPKAIADKMLEELAEAVQEVVDKFHESFDPAADLATLLSELANRYDSERLNRERNKEQNAVILDILRRAADLTDDLLNQELNREGLEFSSNYTRPVGNWTGNPWIAFGVAKNGVSQDRFVGKEMFCGIFINIFFSADMKTMVLDIVPFADPWRKRYGNKWFMEFRPLLEEMRARLNVMGLEAQGFRLDDNAPLLTFPNSYGDHMRRGIIVYATFDTTNIDAHELKKGLLSLGKAYASLVNGNSGESFGPIQDVKKGGA